MLWNLNAWFAILYYTDEYYLCVQHISILGDSWHLIKTYAIGSGILVVEVGLQRNKSCSIMQMSNNEMSLIVPLVLSPIFNHKENGDVSFPWAVRNCSCICCNSQLSSENNYKGYINRAIREWNGNRRGNPTKVKHHH